MNCRTRSKTDDLFAILSPRDHQRISYFNPEAPKQKLAITKKSQNTDRFQSPNIDHIKKQHLKIFSTNMISPTSKPHMLD